MRVAQGSSRIVVRMGDVVIKIAKIRLISPFLVLIRLCKKDELSKAQRRVGTGVCDWMRRLFHHVFIEGVSGNLEEYRFYKRNLKEPLAATLYSIGIVNIQVYCTPIKQQEIRFCPYKHISNQHVDLSKTEHYGWVNGRVCFLDYGNKEVNLIIERQNVQHVA